MVAIYVMLVIAVPGGMLLNEWLKLVVHRDRSFVDGPFVGLQLCQRPHHGRDSALWTASAFSFARSQDAPLANCLYFRSCLADVMHGSLELDSAKNRSINYFGPARAEFHC
jgi:hypothetical protein